MLAILNNKKNSNYLTFSIKKLSQLKTMFKSAILRKDVG